MTFESGTFPCGSWILATAWGILLLAQSIGLTPYILSLTSEHHKTIGWGASQEGPVDGALQLGGLLPCV